MIIETGLITYLISKNLSVGTEIYAERPLEIPSNYILIEKTGSSTENMITTSTVAIQSISGESMLNAISLNEEVKEALFDYIEDDDVVEVGLNSDYNFTDETTKEYRYQAVFEITHY